MTLTKKYQDDLRKALSCAEKGEAYHWPTIAAILAEEVESLSNLTDELERMAECFCCDLNQAHDAIMKHQGCEDPENYDWPEWTPQAHSIRWAEKMLQKKLAKTNNWTHYPEPPPTR